jgi:DNA invertase Pin-like site-specific DNA recombinase
VYVPRVIRAGIYARISSDREGDGLGVRRQVADCEALAERKGWTVIDRYFDDDVSAWSGRPRPEYRRMQEDIRAGLLDAVVVWHLDRLHRQPRELEEFFDLVDAAGLSRLASVAGDVDLATHDGRFTARILGAVSRKESDDKSRRVRRKVEEIALSGRVGGGGTRPYGFEPDRVTIRESEAVVIRDCVARFLAGEAIRSICADLNDRGVATVSGGTWKTQVLRTLIGSPRISGQREHRGEIVADAVWPAIVSPADTARVRAILSDPARRTNRSARRYLLARLLRCGYCGEALVSRPTGGGVRRYMCARGPNFTGCGHTFIQAGTLELFIVEAVLYRLDTPELAAALSRSGSDPDADRCQAEVDAAQAHLDELARAYGERSIGLSEWLAAREPIEARVTSAKRQLSRLSRVSALDGHIGHGSALRDAWSDLPLTRQSAIVAAVLDHAVIGPGRRGYNRFEPDRVTPVWRI